MNKFLLNWFVKKKSLILTFLVLFSLFISENVFAQNDWIRDYVKIDWIPTKKYIKISATVYDYLFSPSKQYDFEKHACLNTLKVEASVDNSNYYKVMDLITEPQDFNHLTRVCLHHNYKGAKIEFLEAVSTIPRKNIWSDKNAIRVFIANSDSKAVLRLRWLLDEDHSRVRYIRISGAWVTPDRSLNKEFNNIIYQRTTTGLSVLKSNTPYLNAKEFKNDTAKVCKDSEAIVIKGAVPGANIKVYTSSGAEIKSVISINDVVKIDLPAKQIYIVDTGKSRYKVAL